MENIIGIFDFNMSWRAFCMGDLFNIHLQIDKQLRFILRRISTENANLYIFDRCNSSYYKNMQYDLKWHIGIIAYVNHQWRNSDKIYTFNIRDPPA